MKWKKYFWRVGRKWEWWDQKEEGEVCGGAEGTMIGSVKSVPDPNKGIFDGRKYCSANWGAALSEGVRDEAQSPGRSRATGDKEEEISQR